MTNDQRRRPQKLMEYLVAAADIGEIPEERISRASELHCSVCGELLRHDGYLVQPCESLVEATHELVNLTTFLDGIGAPSGETMVERVEAVVRHYATQIGRWTKKTQRATKE